MPNGNTVKHGWILLLFVSLYITKRSEAVLQWGEKKKYQKNVERNVLNVIDYLYNYTKIKKYTDFLSNILTCKKLHGIFILGKMKIILKANLLKGRGAKPEGTKVRKLDHVSRLPLFPYHHNIWKRCLNRRDSDTFYTI